MIPGPSRTPVVFFTIILIAAIMASCSGCISGTTPVPGMPGLIAREDSQPDPVVGTWNGFLATTPGKELVTDMAINEEVEKIRLNIYPDTRFEYTTNFTIRNGTLIPTGKGNYIVGADETETERKYFRYDEALDTLKWESRDLVIEFRRNDRVLTASELVDYNTRMKEAFFQVPPAAPKGMPAPQPTCAIASIYSEGFTYDPSAGTIYQMNGDVRIEKAVYDSVAIILRYPDNDEYLIEVGGMGGRNFTKKEFKMILNDRVKNQEPEFFISLDSIKYPAVQTGITDTRTIYTAYTNSSCFL